MKVHLSCDYACNHLCFCLLVARAFGIFLWLSVTTPSLITPTPMHKFTATGVIKVSDYFHFSCVHTIKLLVTSKRNFTVTLHTATSIHIPKLSHCLFVFWFCLFLIQKNEAFLAVSTQGLEVSRFLHSASHQKWWTMGRSGNEAKPHLFVSVNKITVVHMGLLANVVVHSSVYTNLHWI